MKLLGRGKGKMRKIEIQMAESEANLDRAELLDAQSKATLDSEGSWFLSLDKGPTLADIDKKVDTAKNEIISTVGAVCTQT